MNSHAVEKLPPGLAKDLEKKFFWWESVTPQPRSDARILAQAMNFASFADVRFLERTLGAGCLTRTMLGAEPGWFDERSWEFWRGRLMRASGQAIPETPPRRQVDAGAL